PDSEAQKDDVEQVLAEIGVAVTTPRFDAWFLFDLLAGEARDALLAEAARRDDVMPVSAVTGEGVDALIQAVAARLTQGHRRYT
ncbi:hypothetical protein, partial [Enterobacter hormaechei]|uniref:hypothetical protein n=1 Tax=Enterobacter hormaechei TaxID=158836 RepID=UPI001EF80A57